MRWWTSGHAAVVIALIAAGAFLRLRGVGLSLWTDEAWVANSLLSSSLYETLYYSRWLQTTPPGFLLTARAALELFSASEVTLRLLPIVSGLTGLAVVGALVRQALAPGFGLLSLTIVALSPTAVEYSRQLKQYSTEFAVASVLLLLSWRYLLDPNPWRYRVLLAAALTGLFLGYGTVFPVFGTVVFLAFMWYRSAGMSLRIGGRRVLVLAAAAATILLVDYWLFVVPNVSDTLRTYFQQTSAHGSDRDPIQIVFRQLIVLTRLSSVPPSLTSLAAILTVFIVATGIAVSFAETSRRTASWVVSTCAIPVLGAVFADLLGVYPLTARTSLVLLPGLAMLVGFGAQTFAELVRRSCTSSAPGRRLVNAVELVFVAAALAGLVKGAWGVQIQPVRPEEDFAAAASYLASRLEASDVVYIHGCCTEGVRVYRSIAPWPRAPRYLEGTTGMPCCPRDRNVIGLADPSGVREDLLGRVPQGFTGRIWLLYTERPFRWRAIGVHEGEVLSAALVDWGCRMASSASFTNVTVRAVDCGSRGAAEK